MEFLPWVSITAAAVSVAAAAYAARSWPIGVRARLDTMAEAVEASEAIVESLRGKWHAQALDTAAFMEEAEGDLGAVEKKRRRIAASDSKVKQNGGLPVDPADRRLALVRAAREQGHSV